MLRSATKGDSACKCSSHPGRPTRFRNPSSQLALELQSPPSTHDVGCTSTRKCPLTSQQVRGPGLPSFGAPTRDPLLSMLFRLKLPYDVSCERVPWQRLRQATISAFITAAPVGCLVPSRGPYGRSEGQSDRWVSSSVCVPVTRLRATSKTAPPISSPGDSLVSTRNRCRALRTKTDTESSCVALMYILVSTVRASLCRHVNRNIRANAPQSSDSGRTTSSRFIWRFRTVQFETSAFRAKSCRWGRGSLSAPGSHELTMG